MPINDIIRDHAERFADMHNISMSFIRPAMAAVVKDACGELARTLRKTTWPEHHRENGKCVTGYCTRCEIEAIVAEIEK